MAWFPPQSILCTCQIFSLYPSALLSGDLGAWAPVLLFDTCPSVIRFTNMTLYSYFQEKHPLLNPVISVTINLLNAYKNSTKEERVKQ
jgi:hypothetical protein